MRPELMKSALKSLFEVKRTVCIEGAPGGGKTTIALEVAKELGIGSIVIHAPLSLVEDYGVPDMLTNSDRFEYKLPSWYPAADRTDIPEEGILLFDDRNQAGTDIQKILANLCQARELHGHPLKPGWWVVSTGNRQQDRAGANRILSHLRNRETVLELTTHADDWMGWALSNNVNEIVVAYIKHRPGELHSFDPNAEQNATPRSWVEGVSNILGVVPKEAELSCIKGAVGEGAANEFVGFLDIYRNLADPALVFTDPDNAVVPDEGATRYALCGYMSYNVTKEDMPKETTEQRMANMVRYLKRLPPEFSVLTMNMATKRNTSLLSTKAATQWFIDNDDLNL